MGLNFLGQDVFSLSKMFVKAWVANRKKVRIFFYLMMVALPIGIAGLTLPEYGILPKEETTVINISKLIGTLGISISFVCFALIIAYQSVQDDEEVKRQIQQKEEELEKNPENSNTAWDLARIKLESYLNRNISQVRWIFFWTVLVMLIGFLIVIYGIYKVYDSPDNFQPSILATIAGTVTQIIGATFLLIYRSTMAQAKNYVNVLERINAVGMSIQVIETLSSDSHNLKDTAKAQLAKELLILYGNK